MKRLIQREVLNRLSKALLGGELAKGGPKVLDVFDHEVVFRDQLESDRCVRIGDLTPQEAAVA